jgi:hypothetical protein
MRMTLTAEHLRARLHYNPDTGVFTWLSSPSRKAVTFVGKPAGCVKNGYITIGIDRVDYPAHRLAWLYVYGEWPAERIDHINLDRADNRISNLRQCTHSQNLANTRARSTNSSGYKGVYFHTGAKRWQAKIKVNYRSKHLGFFDTKEEAADAYRKGAELYFGEFARAA